MIDEALDFEGLQYHTEKIKDYIKEEVQKESTRAIEIENTKVGNTTVATESSLGLVKSGTDITVDNVGNVSVKDDSHNHKLSNISDVLVTAEELNILNGADIKASELNSLKNITGNIQEQLNKKASLESPVFAGNPEAPTANLGTNTKQIATTEYVQNEINNLGEKASAKHIYIKEAAQNSYSKSYAIPFHEESEKNIWYGNNSIWQEDIVDGEKEMLADDGLYFNLVGRTSSNEMPYAELILGNNKWSNVDTGTHEEGSKYGSIRMYGVCNGYTGQTNSRMDNHSVRILPSVLTGNHTIYLPNASGTLALTTSNVASADIATKATQDSAGNVIADTYAPKVDAVFSINDVTFEVNDKYNGTGNSYYGNGDSFRICVVDRVFAYKMGLYCSAAASGAMAHGYRTTASGVYSRSGGSCTTASGMYSTAEGENCEASGRCSFAIGYGTFATSNNQMVIGSYNNKNTIEDSVFVIGCGKNIGSYPRANAFRVNFDGTTYANGEYVTSGADYAEFFEWLDGNIDNEDRRGYFVTLENDKIRIANPDDYILGIISGQPSVIGNGDEDWRGRYILDEFGSYIYEDIEVTEDVYNKETGELEKVTKTVKAPKQNPEYDSSKPYVQRKDRPEWDCVGMMGVLSVRDDGTCEVNGYCKVTDGGIATASDSGYRVIKRVTDNVVKVVFK